MKSAVVERLNLRPGQRVLAVSDIHGTPDYLLKLLEGVAFSKEDALFVVGDVLEKGRESLRTLRILMYLARRYQVHTLCGNCDDLVVGFVDGREELSDDFFDFYLNAWGERCTLIQMGRQAGLTDGDMRDYPRFRAALRAQFQPELDFLRGLPTIIETEHLLFVHGGIPREDRLEELEAWRCMKNDDFLSQGRRFHKWCIVGHTPVTLYHPHIPCATPIFRRAEKIISIDGGCALKADGQLNLLVLPEEGSENFTCHHYDGLPLVRALDGQTAAETSVNVRWGHSRVEVLTRGGEFSRCRHVETGREMDVLTDYLYEKRGETRTQDTTDYRLGVAPGDLLSVVRTTSRGILAKQDGVTGWYTGRFERENG